MAHSPSKEMRASGSNHQVADGMDPSAPEDPSIQAGANNLSTLTAANSGPQLNMPASATNKASYGGSADGPRGEPSLSARDTTTTFPTVIGTSAAKNPQTSPKNLIDSVAGNTTTDKNGGLDVTNVMEVMGGDLSTIPDEYKNSKAWKDGFLAGYVAGRKEKLTAEKIGDLGSGSSPPTSGIMASGTSSTTQTKRPFGAYVMTPQKERQRDMVDRDLLFFEFTRGVHRASGVTGASNDGASSGGSGAVLPKDSSSTDSIKRH